MTADGGHLHLAVNMCWPYAYVLQSFLKSPSAVNAFTKAGYTIDSSSADSLGNLVAAESTRWGQLARAGALKMD